MGHRTRINGTGYDVTGGKTRINGTGYSISNGRTRINGTGYDISFGGKKIYFTASTNTGYSGTYTAEEGMTWREFIGSSTYNPDGEFAEGGMGVTYHDASMFKDYAPVYPTDVIVDGGDYRQLY